MASTEEYWKDNEEMAERYATALKQGTAAQMPLFAAIELVGHHFYCICRRGMRLPYTLFDLLTGSPCSRDLVHVQLTQVNRSGISHAKVPIKLLDNASGPATLVEVMYPQFSDEQKDGPEILCTDISAPMLELAQKKVDENGWKGVSTKVLDSNDLSSLPDSHFTHVLTGLGVGFVKDPDAALKGGFTKSSWLECLPLKLDSMPYDVVRT